MICECLEVAALRDEVVRLRQRVQRAAPELIRQELGIRGRALSALVLRLFLGPPGAWIPIIDLESCVAAETMISENTIRVYVSRVREVAGEDFIETELGEGYRLSVAARARIAGILGET